MAIVREVSNLPDGINPNPDVHIPTARESSPSLASRFVATGGIITTSAPAFEGTQTWNNAAVTFIGMKLNVTDTASAAWSLLMDLQAGGVSQAYVLKSGVGVARVEWQAPQVWARSILYLGSGADVALFRDAANTLALRRDTSAQIFNIYNTYTDASNYERASIGWIGNQFLVTPNSAGTGAGRSMFVGTTNSASVFLGTAGTERWEVNSSGHFTAAADNTYDIGAGGANRPRNVHVAGTILAGSSITGANMIAFDAGSIGWNSRIRMFSAVDGALRITNNAGTITTDITLSGASSSGGSTATFGGNLIATGNVLAGAANALGVNGRTQIGSPSNGVYRFGDGTSANYQDVTLGSGGANTTLTFGGGIKTTGATFALQTATTLTDNAAAQVATMTNGPTAGNPTKWIAINDNGTTRYIPAW